MNYRVEYARIQSKWNETASKQYHQSKFATIDFMHALENQVITVEVDTVESDE